MRRTLRWFLAGVAAAVLLRGTALASRTPSLDRVWDEDVRVLTPVVERPDGSIVLEQVRDWKYTRDAVVSKSHHPVTVRPEDARALWMYEQELGLGGRVAHTFLVFEFPEAYGDDRWLGISVETRREMGESYSIVRGMLRQFELTHIWAREEDLVRRRVEYLDYPLTRYRMTVDPAQIARIFRHFTQETAALAERPRWYHTLLTNCTSTLIAYANQVEPGAIPWHPSWVFTGRADDYLAALGFVDPSSAERITRDWLAMREVR